jgi:hypothetical protein
MLAPQRIAALLLRLKGEPKSHYAKPIALRAGDCTVYVLLPPEPIVRRAQPSIITSDWSRPRAPKVLHRRELGKPGLQ